MYKNIFDEIHTKYSKLAGNDQIATHKALRVITNNINKVINDNLLFVEIGSGIGTITELILSLAPKKHYFFLEKSEYCIGELKKNVLIHFDKENIYLDENINSLVKKINNLITKEGVNFKTVLIVDDFISTDEMVALLNVLGSNLELIIVEGHRFRQRFEIVEYLINNNFKFNIRYFGNSKNSVKGCFTIKVLKKESYLSILLTKFTIVRFKIHQLKIFIHISQFLGIRKRQLLRGFGKNKGLEN